MFDQTPNNAYPMGGYQFNGAQNMPKVMNVLTEAEIKELQANTSQFVLGLTTRESLQAACNHRTPDGMGDSLVFDSNTGIARCTICGYEFRPVEADASYDTIKEASDRLVDILQTIKIMYTELPAPTAREFFQIIPLIGKIPQLFEFAAKNFAKHDYNAWTYQNHNMGGAAMFNNINNLFGAGFQPQQQPMYNPYAAQPQGFVGTPQPAPMAGANAFGYPGASQQPMYQPQVNQGYTYQPGQMAQPVQPTVQAPVVPEVADAAATDTVTTTVNV